MRSDNKLPKEGKVKRFFIAISVLFAIVIAALSSASVIPTATAGGLPVPVAIDMPSSLQPGTTFTTTLRVDNGQSWSKPIYGRIKHRGSAWGGETSPSVSVGNVYSVCGISPDAVDGCAMYLVDVQVQGNSSITFTISTNVAREGTYSLEIDLLVPGYGKYSETRSINVASSTTITPTVATSTLTPTATPTATSTPSPTPTATATPTLTATSVPTTTNEVKDVRTSNVTDVSFTISFLTSSPSLPALAIWEIGMTATQLVKDFRTDPGETHWYQVAGLKPATTYQYAAYWDGRTVEEGSVQTKAKGSINTPRIAFGQITDQTGHPVDDALVYLTEDGNGLLSTVTDENGWWSTDLGSARAQTSGSFKALGGGPTSLIRIEATAGSAGSAVASVAVDFNWPLSLNLRPVVTRKVALGAGWNTFAFPLEPIGVGRISDLAHVINGDGVTRLSAVYGYDSNWQGSVVSGTLVLGEDLPLRVGEGYFFEMNQPFEWNLRGFTVTQVIPLYLGAGWNLIGVPSPSGLTASDLSDASGIISGTTTYNVAEVDRWTYGRYEGHVAGYPFNNFSIDPDRAYFLRSNRWGRLDPGTGFVPLQ